VCPVIE